MKRFLSVVLAAVLLLGTLTGLASADETYTREQKQEMLVQTALAYYYQNPYVQYDGDGTVSSGNLARHTDKGAPEDAAEDSLVYSVCSNFCYKVYENAFDYHICGLSYGRTRTWVLLETELSNYKTYKDTVAYQFIGAYGRKIGAKNGQTDLKKALEEARSYLQPGDVITVATQTSGHAMLYVGDCLGDGNQYILHCWGSSHDDITGDENYEANGSIKLQTVDELLYTEQKTSGIPNEYLGRFDTDTSYGFSFLRPLDDPKFPTQPTPSAISRLQYHDLKATRELDRNKFTSAHTGDVIPVTTTITNNGKTAYSGIPVEEYVPEGQTLVEGSASGATVDGSTLRWKLDIPAGQSKTVSYKVKLNAKLGETVTFPHGKVAEIPTRETTLTIGGKDLTAEQVEKLSAEAKSLSDIPTSTFQDLRFISGLYKNALGLNINLPNTVKDLLKLMVTKKLDAKKSDFYAYPTTKITDDNADLMRMIIPLHFTGFRANDTVGVWGRTRNYNSNFYTPGDIFIGLKNNSISTVEDPQDIDLFVYLGNGDVLAYDADNTPRVKAFSTTLAKALKYNLLIALRPTLAYEDINTVENKAANIKLTFTDVTEKDWFYTYVKDLVADGTVAGVSATSFAPKSNLTYGQALKLVTMAVGAGEQAPVDGGHWASGYQKYAIRQKWMDKTVDLNANITRLQFCQIAAKAKNLTEQPASNPFKDCSDPAVLALNKAGVIDGVSEGTFAPDNLLTRAQITKIIWCLKTNF